jgi:dihydroanticapsin dehydrogenase
MEGKIALITGAAGGIGRAAALALASAGAKVMISTRRNQDGLEETASLLPEGQVAWRMADAADENAVKALVADTVEEFGGLDTLICNAGILHNYDLASMTSEEWDHCMNVNLKSAFLAVRESVPHMQKRGGGSIVTVGSISSHIAVPRHSAYNASKGGLLMLTKSIAIEFASDRIRANCVCPGWIDTPMTDRVVSNHGTREDVENLLSAVQPLGAGKPEDVAHTIVFLASEEARLITGSSVMVDGGYTAQ